MAATDPPQLIRGDLVDDLPALATQAPTDATLVIFHSSVLYQVPSERRTEFMALAKSLRGHWIANEAPRILGLDDLPNPPDVSHHNVLALDGTPVAWTRPHGQGISWFA